MPIFRHVYATTSVPVPPTLLKTWADNGLSLYGTWPAPPNENGQQITLDLVIEQSEPNA